MLKTFFCKIRNFARKLRDDNVSAFAGQATLFIIISSSLYDVSSITNSIPMITQSNIMIIANNIFPTNISPLFIQIIAEVLIRFSTSYL